MNEFLARLPRSASLKEGALTALRTWIPIVGAGLYLTLWTIAESGRYPIVLKETMFVAWAIAIALAGVRPFAALVIGVVIPIATGALGLGFLGSFWSLDSALSLSTTWPAWLAMPIVVGFIAALNRGSRLAFASLIAGLASAVLHGIVMFAAGWTSWTGMVSGDDVRQFIELVLALCVVVVVAWLIGLGLSALWRIEVVTGRLETTAAQLDEADLELRLAHDRGRISRDIHDSLAHSLAIIVAQAEGAAAIHELKPTAAPESLANIATVGRHALAEVRRLVERINDDDDVSEHTSRIEHIPALVAELRQAGVDATLRTLGATPSLALSKQVAVFRIVQESLTNALKHGGRGSAATVTLDAQGAGLAVLIVSKSGGGAPLVGCGGRGIGIAGMKERARLVGGWLTAVPSDDETFVVTAFIPPDASASGEEPALEASDDLIDVDSQTAVLEIEGARG